MVYLVVFVAPTWDELALKMKSHVNIGKFDCTKDKSNSIDFYG